MKIAIRNQAFKPGIRLNMGSSEHNYKDQFYNGKDIFATSAV
jgi:hypothetical protein